MQRRHMLAPLISIATGGGAKQQEGEMIQVGDWVDICWADENYPPTRARVEHLPQDAGDSWFVCDMEGVDILLNVYALSFEQLRKVDGPDA